MVYGLDQQRGQRRGKGAEGQNFPALTGLSGGQGPFTCLLPAPGYGADGV